MSSLALHNALFKSKWNIEYPIGRVVIFYDTSDHSNYLGFKWERCSLERSPIGYNPNSSDNNYKTIGKQFGEKTHKLTVSEMPSHSHELYGSFYGVYHNISNDGNDWAQFSTGWTSTEYIKAAGGGQAHNTIHPVEVMAFWRRIA